MNLLRTTRPDGQPENFLATPRRKQKRAISLIGNTLGGLLLFCAAFGSVVMIGFYMGVVK